MAVIDAKPKTFRSKAYRSYVAEHGCEVCGRPAEAAHTGTGGKGIKASDATCIPLCRTHHSEQHAIGKRTFEQRYSLDYQRINIRLLEEFIMRLAT